MLSKGFELTIFFRLRLMMRKINYYKHNNRKGVVPMLRKFKKQHNLVSGLLMPSNYKGCRSPMCWFCLHDVCKYKGRGMHHVSSSHVPVPHMMQYSQAGVVTLAWGQPTCEFQLIPLSTGLKGWLYDPRPANLQCQWWQVPKYCIVMSPYCKDRGMTTPLQKSGATHPHITTKKVYPLSDVSLYLLGGCCKTLSYTYRNVWVIWKPGTTCG